VLSPFPAEQVVLEAASLWKPDGLRDVTLKTFLPLFTLTLLGFPVALALPPELKVKS